LLAKDGIGQATFDLGLDRNLRHRPVSASRHGLLAQRRFESGRNEPDDGIRDRMGFRHRHGGPRDDVLHHPEQIRVSGLGVITVPWLWSSTGNNASSLRSDPPFDVAGLENEMTDSKRRKPDRRRIGRSLSASACWTAGAGVEYALGNHWSKFLEYDHIGLPNVAVSTPTVFVIAAQFFPITPKQAVSVRTNIDMVKMGVNYRFNVDGLVSGKN
jgi:hypothetical protein